MKTTTEWFEEMMQHEADLRDPNSAIYDAELVRIGRAFNSAQCDTIDAVVYPDGSKGVFNMPVKRLVD